MKIVIDGRGVEIGGGSSLPTKNGVPAGGTVGQFLAKASNGDYDTKWADPPEGGGGIFLVKAPIGTIVIWSGTADNIPAGWALCDGRDGRPNLRDKFVLGAGTKHAVGTAGGSETVALTVQQMPSHSHDEMISYSNPDGSSAGIYSFISGTKTTSSSSLTLKEGTIVPATTSGGGKKVATQSTGGSDAHPNMPPYYVLCYIIKVAPDPALDGVTMEQVNKAIQEAFDDIPPGSNVPTGGIIIWSGESTAVPSGWALCDGTNGTPDLRGRFVLGESEDRAAGETGGAEEVTLTIEQMPRHRFNYSYNANGTSNAVVANGSAYNLMKQNTEGSSTTAKYTNYLGNSQPHPNMPPYYVLAYIMKL